MKTFQFILLFVVLILRVFTTTQDQKHHREKRFLVFYQGGTFKLVLSVAIPVKFNKFQTIALAWNLQFQYPVPTNITQLKTYPPILKRSIEEEADEKSDRAIFYAGVEKILDREGLNGRECLLRSICENAMDSTNHDANGLYGQLIHIILTPDYGEGDINTDLDQSYFEAQRAGIYGVDCATLYTDCGLSNGVLSLFSKIDDYFV